MTVRGPLLFRASCPDQPGVVAAVTSFLRDQGCSISEAHQHADVSPSDFFVRIAFTPTARIDANPANLAGAFEPIARSLQMRFQFRDLARPMRALVLVSRFGHCLYDLLHRWRAGQLPIDVAAVGSNHDDLRSFAEWSGAPFHYFPVTVSIKLEQERRILELIEASGAELIVLARYMQILSPELCGALAGRCINIHHSFLPSFKGARPYDQAHARGVKIIGATAHYVTTDLDEGPIIEQDVRRVSHARSPEELVAMGQEIEASVLTRAVRWHAEGRVFVHGQRTIVFD